MADMDSSTEALKRSKGFEILIALAERPKHVNELINEVGGSVTTVEQRLEELVKDDFIKETTSSEFPFRRTITLTNKGRVTVALVEKFKITTENSLPTEGSKWILAILYAMGEVKGITRLEKLLFLLNYEMKAVDGQFYSFVPEKFGPYSYDVLNDLTELGKIGLIDISGKILESKKENGGYIIRWNFNLSEHGKNVAEETFKQLTKDQQDAIRELKKYKELQLADLLDYVHKTYKEFQKSADKTS